MTAPVLTDGVVVLDGHTLADVQAQVAGEDDEQARRFGWYPNRSTDETVRSAIERWQEQWRTGGSTRAFALRVDGVLAGGCELRLRDGGAELSYYVFPAFRRRGLATRAVLVAWGYALGDLGLEWVEAHIEPDNGASLGVARSAGLAAEGETVEDGRRLLVLRRGA